MHYILDYWLRAWNWLLRENASRATVLLAFITAWYAFLTWRMAKAIARQTHAMIQPVVLLEFHWKQEAYHPESYFEIKNLGAQPLLLLDVEVSCNMGSGIPFRAGHHFTDHQTLWDEHIIPPGESLCPQFDFKRRFEREKLAWSSQMLGYSLVVVASDLSKRVVLTYRNLPVLSIVNVNRGMPLSVRWRYFFKPFKRLYARVLYRFKWGKLK